LAFQVVDLEEEGLMDLDLDQDSTPFLEDLLVITEDYTSLVAILGLVALLHLVASFLAWPSCLGPFASFLDSVVASSSFAVTSSSSVITSALGSYWRSFHLEAYLHLVAFLRLVAYLPFHRLVACLVVHLLLDPKDCIVVLTA
jgi:hypothetical protein